MKYKLINNKTKEETLCDKITIDGFDYYVGGKIKLHGENLENGKFYIEHTQIKPDRFSLFKRDMEDDSFENCFLIIATTNPNINIPKVVNEIERLTFQEFKDWSFGEHGPWHTYKMFQKGYSKSQETHPNSDEDTIEFGQWVSHNDWVYLPSKKYWVNEEQEELEQKLSSKELLQLWKEQRIKTIYYE